MAGMGVLTGMFLMFEFTKDLDYKLSFGIASYFSLLLSFFMLFSIKDVPIHIKHEEHLSLK